MIYPIILSGGSGTRLWPLSREHYPKQLLSFVRDKTLLQEAVTRLDSVANVSGPLLVCNEEHRFLIADQVQQVGKTPLSIILEPIGRNTAPALTLAALAVRNENEDAVLFVMPSDHDVRDATAFGRSAAQAIPLAKEGRLVTFGIEPTGPETGYGYIKCGADHEVTAFVEKPNLETARRYVKSGKYFWNSGIFVMQASVWLAELARFRPDIMDACQKAYSGRHKDGDFVRPDHQAFIDCPIDSIDYAVMEKTDRAAVVRLNAGWSDVGSWSSLWDVSKQDSDGNVVVGDAYAYKTTNSLVMSHHRLVAAVGLDDVVVVETADAVLVVRKDTAQQVKAVVDWLDSERREEHKTHRRVYRPWGHYEGVDAGERFQVKRLTINPGAALSLQLHHHRAEHWVVVKGTATVTRGEEVFTLSENQSTYIPIGTKHRLENCGNAPVEIVEVQSGDYLGEDDITRFEDKYDRTTEK